jgi:hypothetical protein
VIYLCNLVIFSHYVILPCILQEKNYILTCDAFVTVVDMLSATHLSSFSCYVDMIHVTMITSNRTVCRDLVLLCFLNSFSYTVFSSNFLYFGLIF